MATSPTFLQWTVLSKIGSRPPCDRRPEEAEDWRSHHRAGIGAYLTSGHYKVAVTEHTRGPSVLIMSRRIWDTLSPEDRTIFHDAARASARYMKGTWQSLEEQSRKRAAEAGVTIISDIDRKPFEDATKPLRDELRADPKLGC